MLFDIIEFYSDNIALFLLNCESHPVFNSIFLNIKKNPIIIKATDEIIDAIIENCVSNGVCSMLLLNKLIKSLILTNNIINIKQITTFFLANKPYTSPNEQKSI